MKLESLFHLAVFVGKNDIGKNSILEALDIFFNGSKANEKISIDDLNIDAKNNDNKEILVGVEFSELPKNLVIDSSYNTRLEDEYLLNENGNLEILKVYEGDTLKESVFIRAKHPNNELCSNLLAKKNSELKKIVEQNGIPCQNKTSNSELRKSIWNFYKDSLDIKLTNIEVSKEDAKNIWTEIEKKLPAYSLFTADRKNEDSDSEVQDPLKEAVKQIFKDNTIVAKLDKIATKVREELKKVSDETLRKLNEISPEISDDLHPNIGNTLDLKWSDVFKNVSIAGENDIPLNKRGSGFRRLVLLSFFAAEADRKDSDKGNCVIYAFEEPETSQHSNNQKLLMGYI